MSDGVVIVGGGLAAQRCAEALRAKGFDGAVRVVCGEPHPPYDRPPLSKEALAGDMSPDALALRPPGWYDEKAIDLLLGTRATGLDAGSHIVTLSDGAALRYDKLLVATGSRPRSLPLLAGFDNVQTLRDLGDSIALRQALVPGSRLAVIGGGFIGLEVAATARRLGVEVTVIEALEAPLSRVLGAQVGHWFAGLHRNEGVTVLLGARITGVRGRRRVRELELAEGANVVCDHVLVGVGVQPDTQWLAGSGLDADGVRVDPDGRSSALDVFAAGDVALSYDPALGRHLRGDHWERAARQGTAVAHAMLGLAPPRTPLPSFWSDQYGIRIQYVGRGDDADGLTLDGDPEQRDFQALYTRHGTPVAALLVGRPRALAPARRLVQEGLDRDVTTTARS